MAHHKRRRPKHQRAGCLLCKPHKDERQKGEKSASPPREQRKGSGEHWMRAMCEEAQLEMKSWPAWLRQLYDLDE